MIRALFTAATGMTAQQLNIDTTANNLANVNTTGFKRSRVNFEDLLYQIKREPGTPNADDGAVSFVVMVAAPNEVTGASAACVGCDVFYAKVSRTELRGIVTGDLVAGPVVRLGLSEAGPNQAYRVDVLEVTNRQFALRSPGGYNLTVQR